MAAPQVLSTPEILSIILKHVHHEDRSRRARRNPPGEVSLVPFYMYQDRLTPFLARAMLVDSIWFEVVADILWENAEINDRWKFITPIRQQIYASRITNLRFSPGATDSSIAAHVMFLRLVSLDFSRIHCSARWETLDRYLRPEIRTVAARVLDGLSSHAFLDKLIQRCPHLRVLGLHTIKAEDPAPELFLSLSQLVDLHTIHLTHDITDNVNPPLMSALLGIGNLKRLFLGPGRLPCHTFYDEMKLKTLPRGLRSLRLTGGSSTFVTSLLISSDLVHLEGRIMDHGTNLFARLINMSSIQYLDLRWEHGTNIRARILRSLHQLSNLSWLLLDGPYGPEPKLTSRDLREDDYVCIFSGLRKLRKVHLGIDSNVVFHSFVSLSEPCPELTDFRIQGKCDFDDFVLNLAVPLFPYLNSKPAELIPRLPELVAPMFPSLRQLRVAEMADPEKSSGLSQEQLARVIQGHAPHLRELWALEDNKYGKPHCGDEDIRRGRGGYLGRNTGWAQHIPISPVNERYPATFRTGGNDDRPGTFQASRAVQ